MKKIFIVLLACLTLTGCGIYDKYEQKTQAPDNVFGTQAEANGNYTPLSQGGAWGGSLSEMSWREFFTDPMLQQLIEQVLTNNTDLNSARIAVEKSEASLKAAKMSYLPALQLARLGTLAKFDKYPWA
jgi:outer membrane protein TolC